MKTALTIAKTLSLLLLLTSVFVSEAAAQDIELLRLEQQDQPLSLSVNAGKGEGWQTGLVLSITTDIFKSDRLAVPSDVRSELVAQSMPLFTSLQTGDLTQVAGALSKTPKADRTAPDKLDAAPLGVAVERPAPIDTLSFKKGTSTMTAASRRLLTRVAHTLQSRPEIALIVVEGHAADVALSQQRTHAIIKHLVSHGVEPHRLTSRPTAQDDDQARLQILMIEEANGLR